MFEDRSENVLATEAPLQTLFIYAYITVKIGSKLVRPLTVLVAPGGVVLGGKYGSDASVCFELITQLASNYPLHVFALTGQIDLQAKYPNNIRIIEVGTSHEASITGQFVFLLRYFATGKYMVKKLKPDVVHHLLPFGFGHTFNPLAVSGYLKETPFIIGPILFGEPAPAELFDDLHSIKPGQPGKQYWSAGELTVELFLRSIASILSTSKMIFWQLFVKTLDECELAAAVNRFTAEQLKNVRRSLHVEIIPHGIDSHRFAPSPIPDNKKILTVGALQKRKGIAYLVKAMPLILKEFPNATLEVVGEGPQKTNLIRLSKELGIDRKVFFRGSDSR